MGGTRACMGLLVGACAVSSCAIEHESVDGVGAGVAALGGPPTGPAQIVAEFDPALGQLPENIAVDRRNRLFVSMIDLAQVWRVRRDGTSSILAQIPGDVRTSGIRTDLRNRVYVLAFTRSKDSSANAVWRIDRNGEADIYARLPESGLPNDLAFDWFGNLYVTDSLLGVIWRVTPSRDVSVWLEHPLLQGVVPPLDFPGHPPFPLGVNGIALSLGAVYVANTDRNTVVRISRNFDGSPRAPTVLAAGPAPGDLAACAAAPELVCIPDGIELDLGRNVYVAGVGRSTVVRVEPSGDSELLAGPDEVDGTSDCSFGRRGFERLALYCSNYAVVSASTPGAEARPSVTRQFIGRAGYPRP